MPRRHRPPRAGALADLQPLKILSQIAALQGAYYASATVLILFTTMVAGRPFGPSLILGWQSLRGDTVVGWMLGFVWLLNSFFGSIFLLVFVARSKLVLDFALTLHFVHLVLTSLYSRALPATWLWWALQAASATIMVSLGVWSCRWRELQPLTFGATARAVEAGAVPDGVDPDQTQDDLGGGNKRRGRGRDGMGVYQMVGLTKGGGGTT